MKKCNSCNLVKELCLFPRHKNMRDGRLSKCKICINKYSVKQNKIKKEEYSIRKIKWRLENKSKIKKQEWLAHLRRTYGLTEDDYNNMLQRQNNKCAICRKEPIEFKNKLSVDHRHSDNKIRSLLCQKCNVLIGVAEENILILIQAMKYLDFHNNLTKENS